MFFVVAILMVEFTLLMQQKYCFKVWMISFVFYSTHYKVYIHIIRINTQIRTTSPFDITNVISSSDRQTPWLYQGSPNNCDGDCNYDVVCLLHTSQTTHYCNLSVLSIFPYLNIFVWSITIFDLILRSALVQLFSIMWYIYVKLDRAKVLCTFFVIRNASLWLKISWVSAMYFYYKKVFERFLQYRLVFDHPVWKFIYIYTALTHSEKKQQHFLHNCYCHGWVYYINTTKIWF